MTEKSLASIRSAAGRRGGKAPHASRGHWTPGKRRNGQTDAALVQRLCRELSALRKLAEVARSLGVARKTAWSWSTGVDVPPPATAKKLQAEARKHGVI